MEEPAEELPNYSPDHGRPRAAGPRSEHRYALQDKNGRDWLSFKVQSRAADPKHMPLFLQGDTIKGEVHLDLAKGETLKGITVTVRRHASSSRLLVFTHLPLLLRFAQGQRPWDRRRNSF